MTQKLEMNDAINIYRSGRTTAAVGRQRRVRRGRATAAVGRPRRARSGRETAAVYTWENAKVFAVPRREKLSANRSGGGVTRVALSTRKVLERRHQEVLRLLHLRLGILN